MSTKVVYRNLLEEPLPIPDIEDGILNDDDTISCLCGCHGVFEPEEYEIIKRY